MFYIEDNILDATLNQRNVDEHNTEFYVIKALEADTLGKYMICNQ
jgi:hypothetical protein